MSFGKVCSEIFSVWYFLIYIVRHGLCNLSIKDYKLRQSKSILKNNSLSNLRQVFRGIRLSFVFFHRKHETI